MGINHNLKADSYVIPTGKILTNKQKELTHWYKTWEIRTFGIHWYLKQTAIHTVLNFINYLQSKLQNLQQFSAWKILTFIFKYNLFSINIQNF